MINEQEYNMALIPEFPLSVLLVEQNMADVERCLLALKEARFEVEFNVVSTAEEFMQQIRTETHDVILSDYQLSGWTGLDALELLRRTSYDIPFILLSQPIGESNAIQCFKAGVTDYVMKGEFDRLAPAVFRALEEKAIRNEKRQTQRMLKSNEARFRAIADAVPMAVFIEQGTHCSYVNRAAEELTGYSRSDLLEKNFWQMVLPSSKRSLLERAAGPENPASLRYEAQIFTKSRNLRWLEITVGTLKIDGVVSVLITAVDISERKRPIQIVASDEYSLTPQVNGKLIDMPQAAPWARMIENASIRMEKRA